MVPSKFLRILLAAGLVAGANITPIPGSVPTSADTKDAIVTSTPALNKNGVGIVSAAEEPTSPIGSTVDENETATSAGIAEPAAGPSEGKTSREATMNTPFISVTTSSPNLDAGPADKHSTTDSSQTIGLGGAASSALLGGGITSNESKPTGIPTSTFPQESTHTATDGSQSQSQSTATISLGDLLGSGSESSGNVLAQIEDLLKGVTGLLSPTLLSDLEEVVHDAATLLKGDTTPNTKSLLAAGYKLLNPNSADEIINAIHVAQRIVTPQVISELEEVNLAEVLKEIGIVYTAIKNFTDNYKSYIPDNIAKDLETILNNLTNLLDAATVKDIQGILSSIDDLLTPDVISSLKSLLKSIGPLINDVEPLVSKAKTILTDIEPLISKVEPLIGDLEPLWDKVEPYLSKAGSFVNEYLTPENIRKLGNLIDNIESIVSTISGVVNPTLFKNIQNQTGSLFSSATISKAKNLLRAVWDMLSVQGVENVGTLLGSLESILTPTAVQDIKNVGGLIGPYLTQVSLNKVKSVFSTASRYGEEIWDGAHEVWVGVEDIWDDISPYVKGNASVDSKSLISSPSITKAKDLLSTTWDMLSVQGIRNVGTLLDGLESLLTPTAVQDIRNIGGLIGPFLDQKHIEEFNATLSNVSSYASSMPIAKAKDLASTTWDMLSVQGIRNVGTLLDGLESLLTPTAVQDIRNVGGLVGPFLDQKHIEEFNATISNISSHGAEVYNRTEKYWKSISPKLSEYVTDAENVFDKVKILFAWIGPEITTQNLQDLSGFLRKVANDTSDVVDIVSGLVSSNLTEEVESVVKSAERLLTPKFFDEAAVVLESVANILPSISSFISSL